MSTKTAGDFGAGAKSTKFKASRLIICAGVAAVVLGILVACTHFKGGQFADGSAPIPDHPDWNWDVRPILSQNCFACHGQATQKAGLRLDIQQAAYAPIPEDKSKRAIVTGAPDGSELFKRITSTDADYRMPPKDTHKTLSARDIAVVQRWIKQGAEYKQHWAYITPTVVEPERSKWNDEAVNEIDRYVYARLAKEGLKPAPEADRETLINRVYLDLTGLPPTLSEVDAFVADKDPNAYERVVDRLLSSKEYAERQTSIWMDVARYADSQGGLDDKARPISYPYRDWVISAFERNIPYDKFVTWQLAGDQLPNPTREQLLASAFLKEGRQDAEGGAIDEEFRINYVQERTELVGKDFLGLTVGCAKCHDHKYDVIRQADYYSMSGFFNQMDERGLSSSFSPSTPMGATLEWPSALQSTSLNLAQAVTAAKEEAYRNALREAQSKALAKASSVSAARRAAFAQASIEADTQAYYPLDSGYKGDFASLYINPQPSPVGVPVPGTPEKWPGKTPAQVAAMLQKTILMDVAAGKPTPMLNAPGPMRGPSMAADLARLKADPGLPLLASKEADWALEQLLASGYTDDRLAFVARIPNRRLPQWVHGDSLLWTNSGLPKGAKGYLSHVKFVPGHKGQGIQLHDSVFSMDKGVGQFERTQPYSLDFWLKLPKKPYYDATRPNGASAVILYNNGEIEGEGYLLAMSNNKLTYNIIHNSPAEMLQISTKADVPADRWVHITSTYDGNSKAAGMHLYIDGQEAPVQVDHDHLTRTAFPRGGNSQFGSYFGLASGTNFNVPELVDGALDEVRVLTRALTPLEVAYLQDPKAVEAIPAQQAEADMASIEVQKDPAVRKAWQDLTDARLAEQNVESPIYRVMIAGDQAVPRKNFVLDHGVYNSFRQEVKAQAIPEVFPWSEKLPRNRLGLTEWLFDPKQPLTARVYVNRMWQGHFGTGIVQTVDDFGTQGTNPTHPELLDWLAVEFVKSGWDMKHMHKLMVMSATYRQSSNISAEDQEKDPRNFLLERGPRFRMPAETIRDNALTASGLLVKHIGGEAVFPYAPDAIWDGIAAQSVFVYPTNVPADENHRRSMYTYIKRNAPVANLEPFDMPDRYNASVLRPISNTPLQGLVMLNDVQFMEAYRKLAERAIKASSNADVQLTTLWRLAVRRHPDEAELAVMRNFRAQEITHMQAAPDEVKKLLAMGVAPADASIDPSQLAAMTMVTAGVMNTPDAYTLR